MDNKIGLDVTHYHYKNTGIVAKNISSGSGYSSFVTNGNVYTNDGWEAVLTAHPISNSKGFSWSIIANFSAYVRKWVNDANPDNYEKNGERIDLVYGDGFIRTPTGKMVIDPTSGLHMRIQEEGGTSANRIFGHADPSWQWGVVNVVSYKALSLRFQFDGLVGGVVPDYVRQKTLQGGHHIEAATGALGAARPSDEANIAAYTGEGVNLTGAPIQLDPISGAITNYKDLTETKNTTKSLVQPFVYNDASNNDLVTIKKTYAKLREVTLTYKLPSNLFGKKAFVQGASVSLVGRNLLYFFPSKYKDFDVDQYSQIVGNLSGTSVSLQTPTTRSYGINFNITF